jgi:hypothetical protein
MGLEDAGLTGEMSSLISKAGDKHPATNDSLAPDDCDVRTGIENVPEDMAEWVVSIGVGPEMRRDPAWIDGALRCLTNETTEKDRLRPARLGSDAWDSCSGGLKKLRRTTDGAMLPGDRTLVDDPS